MRGKIKRLGLNEYKREVFQYRFLAFVMLLRCIDSPLLQHELPQVTSQPNVKLRLNQLLVQCSLRNRKGKLQFLNSPPVINPKTWEQS